MGLVVDNFGDLLGKTVYTNSQAWEIISYLKNDSDANIFIVKKENDKQEYILKLEPRTSGQLFCEFHFLLKLKKNELFLPLIDFGVQLTVGDEYQRSIVIPKKKYCLQNDFVFQDHLFDNKSNIKSFYKKIIKSIEHLNSNGWVNGDIKPKNIVFDKISDPYIIDFGLVDRLSESNYIKNKKKMNGTLEYMSNDAHEGIISQRTDLVSFGFILYKILEKKELPWEKVSMKNAISMKRSFLENENEAFYTNPILIKYFTLVNSRKIDERPKFKELINLFNS